MDLDRALCAGTPQLWDSPDKASRADNLFAAQLCTQCPVFDACQEFMGDNPWTIHAGNAWSYIRAEGKYRTAGKRRREEAMRVVHVVCRWCNKAIENPRRNDQRYHTRVCTQEARNKAQRERRPYVPADCVVCGNSFDTYCKAKTCSRECNRVYNEQRAQEGRKRTAATRAAWKRGEYVA